MHAVAKTPPGKATLFWNREWEQCRVLLNETSTVTVTVQMESDESIIELVLDWLVQLLLFTPRFQWMQST